ncbi:galactose mutarotase isoform X2 [Hydra vulgaris]|uniref:Aldose 1-epimerase n=1 Tax=Hydra vulgaris TaxID=6087 RepID=A0ABM4CIU9_HYDVU
MDIKIESFGTLPNGEVVKKFEITNKNNMKVSLINYGAALIGLICPDKFGKFDDILLGFDDLEGYLNYNYFGSTIGRFANRICNGRFKIDGNEYQLAQNRDENHLHGGYVGFDKKLWNWSLHHNDGVEFGLVSDDNDEQYPGSLTVSVIYKVTDDNELKIIFKATVGGKATLVNMTNHAFINLTGQSAGATSILNHVLKINAPSYLPHVNLIPSGEIRAVDKNFDFMHGKKIGDEINDVQGGYDHNYCLPDGDTFCALVYDEVSGRQLEIYTSQRGVQFYSGNFLNTNTGKHENKYTSRTGFCLEPQGYPDNPNHPHFPQSIYRPGDVYEEFITWKVSVKDDLILCR